MKNNEIFSEYEGSLKDIAFKQENSLGRRFSFDDDFKIKTFTPYYSDKQKLILSKSYRRLARKTQVFPPSIHSNVRNRLIHTNEVMSFSSQIANILGLNTDLTEAIAYGHDIGHTPFGHLGERMIKKISDRNFAHNVMSVVVAQKIERSGDGLNLTYETLEGILNHSRGSNEMNINLNISEEATLVMYADKIAYTFSDLNDAIKVGFLKEDSLPEIAKYFGKNQRERMFNVAYNLIMESSEEGKVSFSKSSCAIVFTELKNWMYKNVYFNLDKQYYRKNLLKELEKIFNFIEKRFNGNINSYLAIACMTDDEVINLLEDIRCHKTKNFNYGFNEIIKHFSGKKINIFDADLHKEDFSRKNL
ncbi:MAG: HD domain-containing protein [Candidatus Paceibacterota bacterium]|jgi:dGTPase